MCNSYTLFVLKSLFSLTCEGTADLIEMDMTLTDGGFVI
jgi:hypothetical protein